MKKFFLIAIIGFGAFFAQAASANTCTPTGAGGNWSSSATWTSCGGVAPTASDDVQLNNAVNVTVDGTAGTPNLARSVDATGYSGTLTMGATAVLTIGSSTPGLSNIAIKLPSGFTFAPNAASVINFVSTTSTQQTISINSGYTSGNLTIGSTTASGNYAITANLNLTSVSTLTLTKGTLHMDGASDNAGFTHSWGGFNANNTNTKSWFMGAATINIIAPNAVVWFVNVSGSTLNAGTSLIKFTATGASVVFGTGLTYYDISFTGGGGITQQQSITSHNFTITGTNSKTDIFTTTGGFTVTNAFTVSNTNGTNRLLITTDALTAARTIILSGATVSVNNVDFRVITFARTDAGDLDLTAGGTHLVGDCGGNTRTGGTGVVTFTPAISQTLTGSSQPSLSYSTLTWPTRFPLPQDDVVINYNFVSGRVLTFDMPRLGHTIDATGVTWAGTSVQFQGSGVNTVFGSYLLPSGTQNTNQIINFEGRSGSLANGTASAMPVDGWKLQNGGRSGSGGYTIQAVGGTYKLNDNLTLTVSFAVNNGTFDPAGFNITASSIASTSGVTRAITNSVSGGLWNMTGTAGTIWNITASNLSLTMNGATIVVPDATNGAKTFAGAGLTYSNVTFSGNKITVTGSNTMNTLALNNAGAASGTILTANTTTTVANFITNATTTAARAKILSSSTSTAARLVRSSAGATSVDYMDIAWLAATPSTTTWYAGTHSIDGGNNSGWIFTDPPAPTAPGMPTFSNIASTSFTVGWSAPSTSYVAYYTLDRAPDTGGAPGVFATVTTTSAASYGDTGLGVGSTYWYRVKATNVSGNSAYSTSASSTTSIVPPGAPGTPTFSNIGSSTVTVAWATSTFNPAYYTLERAPNAGGAPGTFAAVTTTTLTTYGDSGLASSTTYWYRAKATNASGSSPYSGNASTTTAVGGTPPGAPGTPTFSNITSSSINVAWGTAASTTYYTLERAPNAGGAPGTFAAVTTTTLTTYNDSGLAKATVYWYRSKSTNQYGDGAYSANASATTQLGAFASSGSLISDIIDTALTNGVAPNSIYWQGTQPAGTTVQFQFASANVTSGPWTYTGWNPVANSCGGSSYYTPTGPKSPVPIKAACYGSKRYLRYKVILSTTDPLVTPKITDIILNYAK